MTIEDIANQKIRDIQILLNDHQGRNGAVVNDVFSDIYRDQFIMLNKELYGWRTAPYKMLEKELKELKKFNSIVFAEEIIKYERVVRAEKLKKLK